MMQALEAARSGARETPTPSIAHVLRDAIEMLATAKTVIDQLTEMLQYFTQLGDSGPLRDYREVRANLLRSRALLSTQPDAVARLTEAALRLSKLIDSDARPIPSDPKLIATQKAAATPAIGQRAVAARLNKRPATQSCDRSPSETDAAPPSSLRSRQGFFDQTVVRAVFSEIEAALRRPADPS
jgi:cell fate (sporulation/competence/biofilm development) regulator YlbF (YheA/YmcA/DUF963 family)